jgi:hypothetical protein
MTNRESLTELEKETMWAVSGTGEDFQCVHVDYAQEQQDKIDMLEKQIEKIKNPTPQMEHAFQLQGTKRFNFALMWKAAIDEALK